MIAAARNRFFKARPRGRNETNLFQKSVKLTSLTLVQDRHDRFEILSVAAESGLHHGSSLRTEFQHLGSPILR